MSVLARDRIIELRQAGDILIEPFTEQQVKNSSYDVQLGHWYWRERDPGGLDPVLNPYDRESVARMWDGPFKAEPLEEALPGIPLGTPVIQVGPGENLLCHTHEFIGTTDLRHTTMMKARSSVGRNQILVCKCAGLGDIGYSNRYTMEITGGSQYRTTLLVPGRRIAQILFMETSGLTDASNAYPGSKYQKTSLRGLTFEELERQWNPEDMLPRMYQDTEAVESCHERTES